MHNLIFFLYALSMNLNRIVFGWHEGCINNQLIHHQESYMHNPRSECLSRTIYIIVSSVKKNGTRFIICVLKWRPTLILHRKKYICFPTPLYIISSRLFDSHVSISITIIESYFNTNRRSNCWNYDLNETCNGSSTNYQSWFSSNTKHKSINPKRK